MEEQYYRPHIFESLKRTKHRSFVEDINSLLRQLSDSFSVVTRADIEKIVNNPNVEFLIVRNENQIVGMVMMTVKRDFRGAGAFIDNLIVDEKCRGQGLGLGRKLMERMIETAEFMGLSHIDLTCNPKRESANHLYQNLGFQKIGEVNGSNYYRKLLD